MAQSLGIVDRIKAAALIELDKCKEGLRFSELVAKVKATDPTFNSNTINGSIWNLDTAYPDRVFKPSRGRFLSVKYKDEANDLQSNETAVGSPTNEEDFYEPFADWLKNEIEDVTHAIPLGGNVFKDKWNTPDVIGKRESRQSDIIKGTTEIVSAEIKTDPAQLITAFGQACAYKLFSHKVYLVVPSLSNEDEVSRLDSLCQIFGIGLVTFDAKKPDAPKFQILVRPTKHEPDLFYTNKYIAKIEALLFP
ncbi:hypothetical protein [Candidatus Binatus soli]|jgi:hypothetical protein|uniref:hypothetical protein n=1 Tax=Candidatus Binatus soli TaxID=1953413 RepID=UPI003D0C7085